jgi:iron complex transport system substrate-binding protein
MNGSRPNIKPKPWASAADEMMSFLINYKNHEGLVSSHARTGLFLIVLLGAGCRTSSGRSHMAGGNGPFPRVIRASEMDISIARKPERIVSLSPSNDEILCALVDEKRIAGLSKFSQDAATSYVADAAHRINVFVDRNAEQIVSLRPDLVIAARYTKVDLKGVLSAIGTPLISTTDFRNFNEVEANIRLIAQAVGEEARAESVIGEMRQKIAAARSRLRPENEGLQALYLASGNFSAGANTSIHEILIAAGLKNAAAKAGINGHGKITTEQILQIDPDVLLIASGYERDRGFWQSLQQNPQLSALKAVKKKRIVEAQARSVLTVSHHVADAVETIVDSVNHLAIAEKGEPE